MSARATAIYFVAAVAVFLALLVLALRPSLVLGVDGDSLSDSVNGPGALGGAGDSCRKLDGRWRCLVYGSGGSGVGPFEVTVDAWGCWKAHPIRRGKPPGAFMLDGCITLLDH